MVRNPLDDVAGNICLSLNWGQQRERPGPPGQEQWKAVSLDDALHKLVEVTGEHASRLRTSAGKDAIQADRNNDNYKRRVESEARETKLAEESAARREREGSDHGEEHPDAVPTITIEPVIEVKDLRTPLEMRADVEAARTELVSYAAGDRERAAGRYHRGAQLAEPMAGDAEWVGPGRLPTALSNAF